MPGQAYSVNSQLSEIHISVVFKDYVLGLRASNILFFFLHLSASITFGIQENTQDSVTS